MGCEAQGYPGRFRARARRAHVATLAWLMMGLSFAVCSQDPPRWDGLTDTDWKAKIGFDPGLVGANGLIGPSSGRRALDYELCVPDLVLYREQVRSIDATLRFSRSPGRVGCAGDELLVIGDSHRPGFQSIIEQLARLPYVKRIDRAWFE